MKTIRALHYRMIDHMLRTALAAIINCAKVIPRSIEELIFASKPLRQIVIETDGDEFAVWSNNKSNATVSLRTIKSRPITIEDLLQCLTELKYGGQPVTVVLHPPCVCVKVFHLATDNPSQWLVSNLAEITPPGNRRDQVLSYRHYPSGELLIAFARTSFLSNLKEILSECKVAVGRVLTGGTAAFNSLLQSTDERRNSQFEFALCSYRISITTDDAQIFPQMIRTDLDSLPGDLPTIQEAINVDQHIDFRSHLDLPKAFPSLRLQRAVKVECVLLIIALFLYLLDVGAKSVDGTNFSDRQYSDAVHELDSLRKVYSLLNTQLEDAAQNQRPRFAACDFLHAVASTTPTQSWLETITYNCSNSNESSNFSLSGFSFSEDDPLRFIDSLRSKRMMRSVALANGSIVENDPRARRSSTPSNRLISFVVTGQYAKQ